MPPDMPGSQGGPQEELVTRLFDLESGQHLTEVQLPLNQFRPEAVMLDAGYLTAMEDGIAQAGQVTPVKVTTLADGEVVVVDGFYRLAALNALGQTEVRALKLPEMTDEQLLDARIHNTLTHTLPELSRVVDWAGQSWSLTAWSEKISVAQAANLYSRLGSGTYLGLSDKETTDIKAWVEAKCSNWDIAHNTLNNCLTVAEGLDPAVVELARLNLRTSSRNHLSLSHLREIGRKIPKDMQAQRTAAETTLRHGLASTALPQVLKLAKEPGTSFEAAAQQVEDANKAQANQPAAARTGAKKPGPSLTAEAQKASYDARNRIYKSRGPLIRRAVFRPVAEPTDLAGVFGDRDLASGAHQPSTAGEPAPKRSLRVVHSSNYRGDESRPDQSEDQARPAAAEIKPGLMKLGRVAFFSEDLLNEQNVTTRPLRIANLPEINQLTKEMAQKFGFEPNRLDIEQDQRVSFNGQSLEPGPIHMEALNVLLASYMVQPPSLKELSTKYYFASHQQGIERQYRLDKLDGILTRWKFQGLVFYNPENRKLAGLQPVIIKDRRQA